jgi:hypothetical protein
MFGHGCPLGDPGLGVGDFWVGAGVVVDGVVVDGVVDGVVVVPVAALLADGAAEAPAIPLAVPAAAMAPATMVAPSIFEMVIRSNLLRSIGGGGVIVDRGTKLDHRRS